MRVWPDASSCSPRWRSECPVAAYAQAAGVDPEALRQLRRMTDYMAALPRFSFDTHDTLEAVLKTGQKLDFDFSTKVTVQRPNRLRAERSGDIVSQTFFYDGKTLTLYNPDEKFYATVPVPDTLEQALDFARVTLDVVAPASDLLYKDAFARLTQDVTGAFVVGQGCHRRSQVHPARLHRAAGRLAGLDCRGRQTAAVQVRRHHQGRGRTARVQRGA